MVSLHLGQLLCVCALRFVVVVILLCYSPWKSYGNLPIEKTIKVPPQDYAIIATMKVPFYVEYEVEVVGSVDPLTNLSSSSFAPTATGERTAPNTDLFIDLYLLDQENLNTALSKEFPFQYLWGVQYTLGVNRTSYNVDNGQGNHKYYLLVQSSDDTRIAVVRYTLLLTEWVPGGSKSCDVYLGDTTLNNDSICGSEEMPCHFLDVAVSKTPPGGMLCLLSPLVECAARQAPPSFCAVIRHSITITSPNQTEWGQDAIILVPDPFSLFQVVAGARLTLHRVQVHYYGNPTFIDCVDCVLRVSNCRIDSYQPSIFSIVWSRPPNDVAFEFVNNLFSGVVHNDFIVDLKAGKGNSIQNLSFLIGGNTFLGQQNFNITIGDPKNAALSIQNVSIVVRDNDYWPTFGFNKLSVTYSGSSIMDCSNIFSNNTFIDSSYSWHHQSDGATVTINKNTFLWEENSFTGGGSVSIDYNPAASASQQAMITANCSHIFRNSRFEKTKVLVSMLPDKPAPILNGWRNWDYTNPPTIFQDVVFSADSEVNYLGGRVEFRGCNFSGEEALSVTSGGVLLTGDSTAATFLNCTFTFDRSSFGRAVVFSFAGGPLSFWGNDFNFTTDTKSLKPLLGITLGGPVEFEHNSIVCPAGTTLESSLTRYMMNLAPWGSVPTISFAYNCAPCRDTQYNLQGTVLVGNQPLVSGSCLACPSFVDCSRDEPFSMPGYYCFVSTVFAEERILSCVLCPEGYCQDSSSDWSNPCIDTRTGVLCGECAEGLSEALGSDSCVGNYRNILDEGKWFYPTALGLGTIWMLFLVWVPVNDNPLWKSVVYFMQVVPIVLVSRKNSIIQSILAVFSLDISVLGLHVDIPLYRGMTAVHKILFDYVLPAALLVILALLAIIHFFIHRIRTFYQNPINTYYPISLYDDEDCSESREHSLVPLPTESHGCNHHQSDDDDDDEDLLSATEEPLKEGDSNKDDEEEQESPEMKVMKSTWYWRYGEALMGGILMMYEGVTTATMQLLNCVPVGDTLRIFRAGSEECFSQWQLALFGVAGCLAVFPIVLLLLRPLCKRYPRSVMLHSMAEVLYKPYKKKRLWWWESYSVVRRLLLVTVAVFVINPMWRQVGLYLLCTLFLAINLVANPFKVKEFGFVETLFLGLLVGLTFLATPEAVYDSLGIYFSDTTLAGADIIQDIVTFLPLFFALAALLFIKRKSTKAAIMKAVAWCRRTVPIILRTRETWGWRRRLL